MKALIDFLNEPAFIFAAFFITTMTGFLVFSRMPRSRRHQTFLIFTLATSWWLFFWGMFHSTASKSEAMYWLRFTHMLSVPFISPTIYWFTLAWRGNNQKKPLVAVGYVMAAFVAGLHSFFTDRIYEIIDTRWGLFCALKFTPFAITYYVLFQSLFCSFGFLALRQIYLQYKTALSLNEKRQLRYFSIALAFGYTGVLDFFAVLQFDTPALGYISVTLFTITIAYALIRHNFLESNLTVQKFSLLTLIYSILLGVLVPIVYVFSKRHIDLWSHHPVGLALGSGFLMGAVLSLGPWIYAYLTQQFFWMKTQSSTGLAHELKSPIGNILFAAESLTRGPASELKTNEYAAIIQKNAERLDHFVQNLLHVARSGNDQINLTREMFFLSDVIHKEADCHAPVAAQKGTQLIIQAESDISVFGDKEKLRQVVSNVIANALKFTPQGTVTLSLKKSPDAVLCSVKDTGFGIPRQELDRVFERFYQGKHAAKGSGIGLTIAKAWVEAHGGKIWAESEGEGKGATVAFTLPV